MPRLSPLALVAHQGDVHLARPLVDAPLAAWRAEGGRLCLAGPHGAGRQRLLDVQASALRAAGRPFLRLRPSRAPWAEVLRGLSDPGLPGPAAALVAGLPPDRRAQAAASRLVERAGGELWLLVDSEDLLDDGTAQTVAALRRFPGVHVLAHGAEGCREATVLTLPPLTGPERQELVDRLLGGAQPASLHAWVTTSGADRPGDIVDLLVCGAQRRVLVSGPQGEVVVTGPAPALAPGEATAARVAGLPPVARAVLGVLALAGGPVSERRLPGAADAPAHATARALERLRALDLVQRHGGSASVRPRDPAALLPTDAAERRRAHAGLVPVAAHATPPLRLAFHLEGAADPQLTAAHGPRAMRALRALDPEIASVCARALTEQCPRNLPLLWERVCSLAAAGHSTEAMQVAEGATLDLGAVPPVAPLLATAALAVLEVDSDETTARALARRARRALGGAPAPPILLLVEAQLLLRSGQVSQALATARRGLLDAPPAHLHPDGPHVGLRLVEGEALARAGKVDRAVDRLRASPPGQGNPAREPLLVAAARMLRSTRRYLDAAAAFADAARNDPHSMGPQQVGWLREAASAFQNAGDREEAATTWEAAIRMAERLGLVADVAVMRTRLASTLRELCRFDSAAEQAARAHEEANLAGAPEGAAAAALTAGDVAMAASRWESAAAWFQRADGAAPLPPRLRARLDRRLAELAVSRQAADAGTLASAAVQSARLADQSAELCLAHALRAVVLAREGRIDQVEATLERALPPLRAAGTSRLLAEARLWAAQAWLAAGRPDKAADEATRALVWADEVGHVLFHRRAEAVARRARSRGPRVDGEAALGRLLEIAAALGRERDLGALLERIADAALHLTEADRAFVILADEGPELRVAAARHAAGTPRGLPSLSVARKAVARGREVIVSDVAERSDLRAQQSIVHLRVRSAMCVPLGDGGRTIGALYVDSHEESQQALSDSIRLLRALASQAAVAVTNARLLAETRRRAEWAAEMAHDLRSPMASVVMAAEHLADTAGLDQDDRETAALIGEQARRVVEMAERFLADRAGQPRDFDLAERVRRQVEVATRKARARDQRVVYATREQPVVHAVPEDLDRAVTNLLSNALTHTPAGTAVEVEVGLVRGEAVLVVRDHGPGIPPALIEEIFERGRRADAAKPGHGLGLAIVRRMVEEAGGSVTAANHPLGGAEFRVRLPIARGEATTVAST